MALAERISKLVEERLSEGYMLAIQELRVRRGPLYDSLTPYFRFIDPALRTKACSLVSQSDADLGRDVEALYHGKEVEAAPSITQVQALKPYTIDLVVFEGTHIKRLILPSRMNEGVPYPFHNKLHAEVVSFIFGALEPWIPSSFPINVYGFHAEEARNFVKADWQKALDRLPYSLSLLQINFNVERLPLPGFLDHESLPPVEGIRDGDPAQD